MGSERAEHVAAGPAPLHTGLSVNQAISTRLLRGLLACAVALPLIGCAEREAILPGDRLGVRELLESDPGAPRDAGASRSVQLPGQVANAAWSQSPVSPAFRVPHAALQPSPSLLWSVDIGQGDTRRKRLNVDPVVAGGAIFTIDADHMVRATSVAGVPIWNYDQTPLGDAPFQAQGGGLAYAGGRLYVASGFGKLTALDAGSGAEIWVQQLGNTATGAPTVSDGLVYVTSGDSVGWAIETDDGRIRWQIDGAGDSANVAGAPAPALDEDRVVFAFGENSVQAAFRQGGLRLWNADILGRRNGIALATITDITGDPLISGDTVFVGTHSGRLVALDAFSGDRLWTTREGALGPVWPVADAVFLVTDRNALARVDRATGEVVWTVDLPAYLPSRNPNRRRDESHANHGPVLAGGRLWVASTDGFLRGFRPEDGGLAAQIAVPRGATTRPVVAGGTLYVVSTDGVLHAFR